MGRQMIAATGNPEKMVEIRQILAGSGIELMTMKEAGLDLDIIEDGNTFEENALIKARAVARASGKMAIADDSGLVVDAMGGEPGIHSARWMGHDTSYEVKNREIIRLVDEFCAGRDEDAEGEPGKEPDKEPGKETGKEPGPLRAARFVCAVAVVWPDGRERTATGVLEGRINTKACGENGFGYDPIFYLPEYGMTSGQIPREEKNRISHRGQAFRKIREILEEEDG